MRIEQLLSDSAARLGHKAAIVTGRAAHSYAELDRKSDRLAAALAGRGIKRGDHIATFLDTGFATVVAAFGVLKAGATLCPTDPATGCDALAGFLNQSRACGIVTEARLASRAATAMREAPAVKLVVLAGGDRSAAAGNCISFEDAVRRIEGAVPFPAGGDADAAITRGIVAADGTIGLEIFSHAETIATLPATTPGDDAAAAPRTSIASHQGIRHLISAIAAGATLVLESTAAGRAPFVATPGFGDMRLALA